MDKVTVLIPCAGQGKRMGGTVSKPYLEVLGRPLLTYTLDKFQGHPRVDAIILIVQPEMISYCKKEIVDKHGYNKVRYVIAGGEERQDSVMNGLALVELGTKWILVHDAVRPLVTEEIITRAMQTACEKGNAVVGMPVKDTIKKVGPDMIVQETPDRRCLWHVQTPQVFPKEVLKKAYREAVLSSFLGTDDASLVEKLGIQVHMVKGEYTNIKITTPEDLIYLKELIRMGK